MEGARTDTGSPGEGGAGSSLLSCWLLVSTSICRPRVGLVDIDVVGVIAWSAGAFRRFRHSNVLAAPGVAVRRGSSGRCDGGGRPVQLGSSGRDGVAPDPLPLPASECLTGRDAGRSQDRDRQPRMLGVLPDGRASSSAATVIGSRRLPLTRCGWRPFQVCASPTTVLTTPAATGSRRPWAITAANRSALSALADLTVAGHGRRAAPQRCT